MIVTILNTLYGKIHNVLFTVSFRHRTHAFKEET